MSNVATKKANKAKILNLAKKQQAYVVSKRHDLHQIPELSWEETLTLQYIKAEIDQLLPLLPYDTQLVEMEGGIYVDIDIDPSLPRTLLRSDIDGLPIQEETGLPFASKHPGLMHACGHDCHAAMLLGALRSIASGFPITKNLRLVWQRAEEALTTLSGGRSMVENGLCDGIHEAYALHVTTHLTAGVFSSKPDVMMSNAAHLEMEITCRGGHVMRPNNGPNAVDIATEIQVAMRGFPSRALPPEEKINFVPSFADVRSTYNVMASKCHLGFSVRNFLEPRLLHDFIKKLKNKVESIVYSYDEAKISKFAFHQGYPVLTNDIDLYAHVKEKIESLTFKACESPEFYSGEDFSFYANACPINFWLLGTKQGPGYDHHTPLFNPDESVLWQGVAFWLALV